MKRSNFHDEPYDEGTLTKLKIFEYYAQAWIPVFLSKPEPPFEEIHIFDPFCGPGGDSAGALGSPLRILQQIKGYQSLAGWHKVKVAAHFSDANKSKIAELNAKLESAEWQIPNVEVKASTLKFQEALEYHKPVLSNPRSAKLLIIDQFGVDAVNDNVFKQLISFPRTDFIFFLSSSTLNRFKDHPSIRIKIDKPDDSQHVHRAAFDYYRQMAPPEVFLGRFSIRKKSNIYGLIFGSKHPLGIHKFLSIAWGNDRIAGEANFDI